MVDQGETTNGFDSKVLIDALREGEELVAPSTHTEGDLRDQYGYEVYPIRDKNGEEGNSVFLVMYQEGDAVEPVELVGPVKLTISPIAGEGLVILHTPELGVSPNLLAADGSPNNGGEIELMPGDSYGYLNMGAGPFVIRDDSTSLEDGRPHFETSYEVPAVNQDLLGALAELGIQGAGE